MMINGCLKVIQNYKHFLSLSLIFDKTDTTLHQEKGRKKISISDKGGLRITLLY